VNVEIKTTRQFEKNAKFLIKKYKSLKEELNDLQESLLSNPCMGVQIKENVYKIRLAVKSKGKGKSGGLRIINYISIEIQELKNETTIVYLLSIYDKSDTENISDSELKELISDIDNDDL
jgi:mRNA-degrading endonuclease RelE of RelBE toxin-antitoxin system